MGKIPDKLSKSAAGPKWLRVNIHDQPRKSCTGSEGVPQDLYQSAFLSNIRFLPAAGLLDKERFEREERSSRYVRYSVQE